MSSVTKYLSQIGSRGGRRPDLVITSADVPWVAEQLMRHGNREAWIAGSKLCR
jgi:hypothetical protein